MASRYAKVRSYRVQIHPVRKEYAWPPGTLALVHDPGKHGGAKDITHARYGRVIRMEKDVPRFEALRDRATTL